MDLVAPHLTVDPQVPMVPLTSFWAQEDPMALVPMALGLDPLMDQWGPMAPCTVLHLILWTDGPCRSSSLTTRSSR
jgi:hypothetical protein